MITANCKQKENKPKEASLPRTEVAHFLLGKSKNKQAAHGSVQADTGFPWCRALCLHLDCRTHLTPEQIPFEISMHSVQGEGVYSLLDKEFTY